MKKIFILMFALLLLSGSITLTAYGSSQGGMEERMRMREMEGKWLFDATATSKQLLSSSDNELYQERYKNQLELQHGNQVMDIKVMDAQTLRVSMYNQYDDPDEENTFEMRVEYNRYRDYFSDDKIGLIALMGDLLAFQPSGMEASLLFRPVQARKAEIVEMISKNRKAEEARKAKEAMKSPKFIALSESKMNWNRAKTYCQQHGGRLPFINGKNNIDTEPYKGTPVDGFGAIGSGWPAARPDGPYWTGTSADIYDSYIAVIINSDGQVEVAGDNPRNANRVVCVP
jgi:hypothetical protein